MERVKEYVQNYYIKHQKNLLEHYPGLSTQRLLHEYTWSQNSRLDEARVKVDQKFWSQLKEGIPLEYMTQNAFFYRSNFLVNKHVLIPRKETEILVEDSIQFIQEHYTPQMKIAEIGVGSFCIGLSILIDFQKPLTYWGGDISEEALDVAYINQFRLNSKLLPTHTINLIKNDRLNDVTAKFDLIVSNPPYIKREHDAKNVHLQTHNFEPHVALYLKDELYNEWFEALFKQCTERLNENGAFFMEGHEDNLNELSKLAEKYFSKVELKNDYTKRLRFLYCYR